MKYSDESNIRHQQVWELLPWYVNGTASADERRIVDEHLMHCEDCREEAAFQRRLSAGMALDTGMAPDADAGLARLWERIDHSSEVPAVEEREAAPPASRKRASLLVYGLAAMIVLQAGGLAILGTHFLMPSPASDVASAPAAYRTLSSTEAITQHAASRATIRIVPAPGMRMEELGSILQTLQLQVVAGPTEAGVYSLAPMAEHHDTVSQLARLRATPGIRFAEPVGIAAGNEARSAAGAP